MQKIVGMMQSSCLDLIVQVYEPFRNAILSNNLSRTKLQSGQSFPDDFLVRKHEHINPCETLMLY